MGSRNADKRPNGSRVCASLCVSIARVPRWDRARAGGRRAFVSSGARNSGNQRNRRESIVVRAERARLEELTRRFVPSGPFNEPFLCTPAETSLLTNISCRIIFTSPFNCGSWRAIVSKIAQAAQTLSSKCSLSHELMTCKKVSYSFSLTAAYAITKRSPNSSISGRQSRSKRNESSMLRGSENGMS